MGLSFHQECLTFLSLWWQAAERLVVAKGSLSEKLPH